MLDKGLRQIDFAALETLRLVYRHLSFTAAAVEMDVKQSSVSYTIDRLRSVFADPLFVRQGNSISATERCKELVESAERVLGEMERAAQPLEFDASTTTASIAVSATYLSRSVLMPNLIREVRRQAPGITIELRGATSDPAQQMLSGRADLVFSPATLEESGISGKPLFEDRYVCLMDPANPLARQNMTLEAFVSAAHLIVQYGYVRQPLYHEALKDRGIELNVAVSTPEPEDARLLLPGTDLIVAMPSMIARQFTDELLLCPCPVPAMAAVNMYWPARLNVSPLHAWFRDKATRLAAKLHA